MSLIARLFGKSPAAPGRPTLQDLIREMPGLHRLFPDDPERLLRLGALLFDRSRQDDGNLVLERAIELGAPEWRAAMIRTKRALIDGQAKAAMDFVEPYVQDARRVADPELYLLAGSAAWEVGQYPKAIEYYEAGAALRPRDIEFLGSLCGALGISGQFEKSHEVAQRALQQDRRHASTLQNLAIAARELLKLDEHRQAYVDLCDFYPDNERFRCLHSYALLMEEDFAAGWPLHENRDFRYREQGFRESTLQAPRWKGESLEGKTLLIVCEQGAGDNFMVARWFPEIKRRGARVVVECIAPLMGILGRVPGVDQVIMLENAKEPDLHYDLWVGSMSLPWIFNVTRENIHAPARYLEPSRSSQDYWKERVAPARGLKIGLAWAGNPGHSNDLARSMKFSHVAPLLDIPGTTFFNLQVPARDLAPRSNLLSYTDELLTFDDTAGLIDQMDLVICVDTSIAHLSCALGRPTWIVSSMRPEWRWGRVDLPVIWYPTARLYCCERPLYWASAINHAARDIRSLIAQGNGAAAAGVAHAS